MEQNEDMKQQPVYTFHEAGYLDAILENVRDGVYITDNEANTIYLNSAYERISGLMRAEMIGKNMRDLVENGVISVSGTLSVLETGQSVTTEQNFRTGRRAEITSTPVREDAESGGHIIMVVTIVREITELYLVRRQMQRLAWQNREYGNEIRRLNGEISGDAYMVAEDASSLRLMQFARRVAAVDTPVLISGEEGTGKEKLASFIHMLSGRSQFPFLSLDWRMMPAEGIAGYLFGYEDEQTDKYHIGALEGADGGTVYVNDICAMPFIVQDRFASLLKTGSCTMGDGVRHRLNIRFIASGVSAYAEMLDAHPEKNQILQCFCAFHIETAPLRERRDDILPLANHFLGQHNRKTGEKKLFSGQACRRLLCYDWPGNVQELRAVVQRAAIASEGERIADADLMFGEKAVFTADSIGGADGLKEAGGPSPAAGYSFDVNYQCADLKYESARLEAYYMERAYDRFQNIRDAASSLGIDSSTFVRKRQRYRSMGLMRQ